MAFQSRASVDLWRENPTPETTGLTGSSPKTWMGWAARNPRRRGPSPELALQLALLDAQEPQGRYWNTGYFNDVACSDIDGDGVKEIIAGGIITNTAGCLAVLEAGSLAGSSLTAVPLSDVPSSSRARSVSMSSAGPTST